MVVSWNKSRGPVAPFNISEKWQVQLAEVWIKIQWLDYSQTAKVILIALLKKIYLLTKIIDLFVSVSSKIQIP
jgi:TctA family transporter